MISKLKLLNQLFWTVKYLRFEQIFFRFKYFLIPVKVAKLNFQLTKTIAKWHWQQHESSPICFLPGREVRFINETASLDQLSGWNDRRYSKLWLYNLHYFDDLNARDSARRFEIQYQLVTRWIEQNPAPEGNGWEPYPLSLRLVNWVKWCSRHSLSDKSLVASIGQQVDVLYQRLEYNILGNHLFANAKALVFVGCYLGAQFGQKYLDKGLQILRVELQEQFLADGAHFELSPMYQATMLWDVLDLINLAKTSSNPSLLELSSALESTFEKGIGWYDVMLHPDQQVAFFNDSAMELSPTKSELLEYASKIGLNVSLRKAKPLQTLRPSGYSRVNMPRHVAFFDHASVGPDYLPGHAHADTLSLEWTVLGKRILVNSGTSVYGNGEERLRQRKTAAHNTVQIDGRDSSEVWSGFKVARRAKVHDFQSNQVNGGVVLSASHNGYARMFNKLMHHRQINCSESELWVVDKITGKHKHAVATWHLHPSIAVTQLSKQQSVLTDTSGLKIVFSTDGELQVQPSSWHPKFGVSVASTKLVVDINSGCLNCRFLIS